MSPIDHGRPCAADAFVHLVADQLIAELRTGLEPSLVQVKDEGAGRGEIGMKPLEGIHPSEVLVGFTAPPAWHAIGLAVRGFAYPMRERNRPDAHRWRVHVVTLVTRNGEVAQRLHAPEAPDLATALDRGPEHATGEQVDLLRLALGLGTEEPPCAADVYWTIEWLSSLLGTRAEDLETWSDVAAHHPAMRVLHHAGRDADDLVEAASTFSRVCTWTRMRKWLGDGTFTAPELVPSDGTWFDDGAFARFLLCRCPPLAMLRANARDHLGTQLADQLDRLLDQLGIPASSWPEVSGAVPDR
jgi:hypothetical protein